MINKIHLPEEIENQYRCSPKADTLTGLNRINIFIGPNNSGKSRLMRNLFKEELKYQVADYDLKEYRLLTTDLFNEIDELLITNGISEINGISNGKVKEKLSSLTLSSKEEGLPNSLEKIKRLYSYLSELTDFRIQEMTSEPGGPYQNDVGAIFDALSVKMREIAKKYLTRIPSEIVNLEISTFKKIYTPILRGLRPIDFKRNPVASNKDFHTFEFNEKVDNYKWRTVADYFCLDSKASEEKAIENITKFEIATGLRLYEETKHMLLGSWEERDKIRSFETFLSQSFFQGRPISLTPREGSDCLMVSIDEADWHIYELGDGIQTLIILLYPLFFNVDKQLLYFIEEPELSLHPGMQRLFIDTIMQDRFKNAQIFLTTHSNHFLDMTLDHRQISLYNFQESTEAPYSFNVVNTSNEDIRLLDTLGVHNSSIFLSNCTIWIEGITDRLYLNKYIEVIQRTELKDNYETKRLKEDLHFSFVEYAGANITHYNFDENNQIGKIKALKISSKILLIMDEDGALSKQKSAKFKRIKDMESILGDRLILLPCREIDNTLSPEILKAVIRKKENNENIAFPNFTEKSYKNQYLGSFIEKKIPGLKKKYADDSGTIADKINFCRSATSEIKDMKDLSGSAIKIGNKILDFVKSCNNI